MNRLRSLFLVMIFLFVFSVVGCQTSSTTSTPSANTSTNTGTTTSTATSSSTNPVTTTTSSSTATTGTDQSSSMNDLDGNPAVTNATNSVVVGGEPLLKPGTKVLHIGDSHTAGIYGTEMDKLMRDTGAKVQTYGVSGSSPSWWWNGTTTKSGYFGRDEEGNTDRPANWRTPRQTPNLEKLIREQRPEVLVVSLGANMTGQSAAKIEADARKLLEIAKAAGTKIVWVGPPNGRDSPTRVRQKETVCNVISRVVQEYGGKFIDSRQHTAYPSSGGDGVHFWGSEGKAKAENWANKVMDGIQGRN